MTESSRLRDRQGGGEDPVVALACPQKAGRTSRQGDEGLVPGVLATLPRPGVLPWVLSAPTDQALRDLARKISDALIGRPGTHVADTGFTLATGGERFERRAVVMGRDPEDFRQGLDALADGRPAKEVVTGSAGPTPEVAFVFPGQGSQWPGMGIELADASPLFRQRLSECGAALSRYCDWSLADVLRQSPGAPSLDRVDVVQPALFAVMLALTAQWEAYGVRPAAAIGHSQGEIAAACAAGILPLEDAARVVALRSQALASLTGDHGMAAFLLGPDMIEQHLTSQWDGLSVAVVNGPRNTVLAGPRDELLRAVSYVESLGEQARMLPVDYASHSVQVEAVRERVLDSLADIKPEAGHTPLYSAVTGERIDGRLMTGEYWYRNLRSPVHFNLAARTMISEGLRGFVEASPHPLLLAALDSIAESTEATGFFALGSLKRNDGGPDRMLRSLAEAHVRGVEFDAQSIFGKWHPKRERLVIPVTGEGTLEKVDRRALTADDLSAVNDRVEGRRAALNRRRQQRGRAESSEA